MHHIKLTIVIACNECAIALPELTSFESLLRNAALDLVSKHSHLFEANTAEVVVVPISDSELDNQNLAEFDFLFLSSDAFSALKERGCSITPSCNLITSFDDNLLFLDGQTEAIVTEQTLLEKLERLLCPSNERSVQAAISRLLKENVTGTFFKDRFWKFLFKLSRFEVARALRELRELVILPETKSEKDAPGWEVHPIFLKAETIASRMGDRYRVGIFFTNILSAFAVLIAVAGLAYDECISERFHHFPVATVAELLVILSVVALVWLGKKQAWHRYWLDSRRLAEQVRLFAMLSPLSLRPFLDERNPMDWVSWVYRRHVAQWPPCQSPISLEAIKAEIINSTNEQIAYHRMRAHKEHHRHHFFHAMGARLFFATMIAVVLHLFWHTPALSVIATFFPALGSAFFAINTHEESERVAAKSEQIIESLGQLIAQLTLAKTIEEVRMCAMDIAKVRASELQDWNELIGNRALALPA